MDTERIKKIRSLLRVLDREMFYQNNASCCDGISLSQCHTLLEVEKQPEITISELAANMTLDKSTVSRTIDGLVNIQLVDRLIPEDNRRKAHLTLTNSGRKVCEKINYTNDNYIHRLFGDFSEKEQQEFLRLFEKLIRSMKILRQETE